MVLDLVEKADILIEGFRPGVTERLGLGPDACLARNPQLVYGRMTGWGQDGPLAHTAGHDINYISVAGALDTIGRAGGPPQIPLNLLGDFAGGSMYLVTGVLAALTHARAGGEGQVVDAAITDGVAHLLAMPIGMMQVGSWQSERGTNLLDSGVPIYDVYETSDGRWMSVGGLEPQFWAAMEQVLGQPYLTSRHSPIATSRASGRPCARRSRRRSAPRRRRSGRRSSTAPTRASRRSYPSTRRPSTRTTWRVGRTSSTRAFCNPHLHRASPVRPPTSRPRRYVPVRTPPRR